MSLKDFFTRLFNKTPGAPCDCRRNDDRKKTAALGAVIEKRKFPRVEAVDLRFKVLDPDYRTDMLEKADLKNISLGGCCFLTEKNVPEKAHLLILFGIPFENQSVKTELTAEVVRSLRLGEASFEIGTNFLNIRGTRSEEILGGYIDSLLQGS